jgi:hypothetical protein
MISMLTKTFSKDNQDENSLEYPVCDHSVLRVRDSLLTVYPPQNYFPVLSGKMSWKYDRGNKFYDKSP